ncbi:MAG: hypothetical protein K1X44_04370 [Alphaproteobacteria bacterium]|nr:hypothetical protein [Alphaproteobacteria bacterium]
MTLIKRTFVILAVMFFVFNNIGFVSAQENKNTTSQETKCLPSAKDCNHGINPQNKRGMGRAGLFQRNREPKNLTSDEIKTLIQARLIMSGKKDLQITNVTKKDDKTYLVDISNKDKSLVRQIEVDKDTGFAPRKNNPAAK